jgi:hypothetical protein
MEYLLVIHNDPETHPQPGGPGWDELMAGYYACNEHVKESGAYKGGNALMPPNSATTIRIRDGRTVTTDGPFAETKEWMSGYYLVDVANLEEAMALAARIPSAKFGSVEVRPIMTIAR